MNSKSQSMDGCQASTYVSYALCDAATIYPISPASDMGELADQWASEGKLNLMGQTMVVKEMESEAGAAGAVHGCLSGGALTTTYTASQGLMLMIPNMYKISGELLPAVFHVTARSLSAHALSIFGDHQDVMTCRPTGFAMLASSSVQECMDLGMVAHLAAIEASVPFMHFFDGWRTSSEIQTIQTIDYETIRSLVNWDKVEAFRRRAMNSEHPDMRGTAQNPDVYFQNREAANAHYIAVPDIVEHYMALTAKSIGRQYHLFDYVGHDTPNHIIISMASSCNTIEEVVNYLNNKGEQVGLVKVRLFRPFSVEHLLKAIPKSTQIITVLDRSKEPGSNGEALYQDVTTAIHEAGENIKVLGGRYGLSSKEFTPCMVKAIFENMKNSNPKNHFTIGIDDDVTHLSIPVTESIETTPPDTIQCKFFGFGSDGTVGANKQAIEIIGENTNLYTQGYFAYDSKKSGGYTVSHLRFGKNPINSSYEIIKSDYIACHKDNYVYQFDVLKGIKPQGIFVLNSAWDLKSMESKLPPAMRREIATKQLKFYNIDAAKLAESVGLDSRINMIMQTVFFKLSQVIPFEQALTLLKASITESYEHEGTLVVQNNLKAIEQAVTTLTLVDYPESWKDAQDTPIAESPAPPFVVQQARPILALEGDKLPVSILAPDGILPLGSTAYEKRGVAFSVPQWSSDICIQCTQCSFVCPHAAIRPYLATDDELKGAPSTFNTVPAEGGEQLQGLHYRIQTYSEDCQGCGSCVNVCPVGALQLQPFEQEVIIQKENLTFAQEHISIKDTIIEANTIRGTQFKQPLFEFSGACAGCGETPYIKLATQLFGEHMLVANATGCSSIYGASMPSMPYCKSHRNLGPAWGNSLFEDAAEYGYGIATAVKQRREKLEQLVALAADDKSIDSTLKPLIANWQTAKEDLEQSYTTGKELLEAIAKQPQNPTLEAIVKHGDLLGKKSIWIFGGDGWAYDIGYGGLDHVIAAGENINILVLDTECYSNTGGQTSKATPLGAIAKFSSAGKRTNRKNLGRMAMVYGNVYVASIALGGSKQQAIDAMREAEAYPGTSIIIALCPCINWGIRKGMGTSILEEEKAVKAGYWPLYRYNPKAATTGKPTFTLDYEKPDNSLNQLLDGEDRYADLVGELPKEATILRAGLQDDCNRQYDILSKTVAE